MLFRSEITEKERGIILRKAISLGIDKEEICLILNGRIAQFKKEIGDVEKDEMALILKSHEFLKSCGVPQEICEDLEIHHITKLIEMISVKKN